MKIKMKKNYVEMPFKVFLDEFPEAINMFPVEVRSMLLSDPCYIVRLSEDGKLEVGYLEDNWSIS